MICCQRRVKPFARYCLLLAGLLSGPPLPAAYLVFLDGQAHIGKVSRQHDGSFLAHRPGKESLIYTLDKVAWFSDAESIPDVIEEWHGALLRQKGSEPGPGWLSLVKFCTSQDRLSEALAFAEHWGQPRKFKAGASKRFIYLYKTKPETFRAASSHLEAVIDWLVDELPPGPEGKPGSLVFILPDEPTALELGRPTPVSGAISWYLSSARELILIDWSRSSLRATMSHLTRVAAQYYLKDVYLSGIQVYRSWVIDGLSSYFQGLVVKAGKATGVRSQDRERLDRIRVNLKAGTHIPLERFLKFGYDDILGGDPYNVFQAQAWSLAWYLMEPGRKETDDLLRRFLDRLRNLKDEQKAWDETFERHDLAQLEQAWRKAVMSR